MESAKDIKKYLNIIEGNFDKKVENSVVDLGIYTAGARVGNVYLFENGLRWAKIVGEETEHWLIEHGLIEYESDDTIYLSKHDVADMIKTNDMVLFEKNISPTKILIESTEDRGFTNFVEGVQQYLFKNNNIFVEELEYNWRDAYDNGLTPLEAAEEALILG